MLITLSHMIINIISHQTDWLLSRRHCKQEWREQVPQIREKINVAIQDMPATDELTQLLHGTCKLYSYSLTQIDIYRKMEIIN